VFAKAVSPTTLLNPFRLIPLGNAGTTALKVDKRDGPIDLVRFALTMQAIAGGKGIQTTVPIANPDYRTPVGSTVRWDRAKALELFRSHAELLPPWRVHVRQDHRPLGRAFFGFEGALQARRWFACAPPLRHRAGRASSTEGVGRLLEHEVDGSPQ
jgi:hypothetical protein